jgi:hypothetical protein
MPREGPILDVPISWTSDLVLQQLILEPLSTPAVVTTYPSKIRISV